MSKIKKAAVHFDIPAPFFFREKLHWRHMRHSQLGDVADLFVMEAKTAEAALGALTALIRNRSKDLSSTAELSPIRPIGFGSEGEYEEGSGREYDYALYADGLALLATPPRFRHWAVRHWLPKEGLSARSDY